MSPLKTRAWASAMPRLATIAACGAALLLAHCTALVAWARLRWLKGRRLPSQLVFPRLELQFLDASCVAVTQAMAMLLAGGFVDSN